MKILSRGKLQYREGLAWRQRGGGIAYGAGKSDTPLFRASGRREP